MAGKLSETGVDRIMILMRIANARMMIPILMMMMMMVDIISVGRVVEKLMRREMDRRSRGPTREVRIRGRMGESRIKSLMLMMRRRRRTVEGGRKEAVGGAS
jgi:hypothetical protein